MKLKPLRDEVLIRIAPLPTKVGAIHLPQEHRAFRESDEGTIVAVSERAESNLVPGQRVMFERGNGTRVPLVVDLPGGRKTKLPHLLISEKFITLIL